MSKQKYTHMQLLLPEIKRLMAEGKSHTQIERMLGLEGERPIHHLLKRQRRKERKGIESMKPPIRKGRPRKTPRTAQREMELRIKELEREVDLLRSFLHAAGRM